jgi:hypothetical protein
MSFVGCGAAMWLGDDPHPSMYKTKTRAVKERNLRVLRKNEKKRALPAILLEGVVHFQVVTTVTSLLLSYACLLNIIGWSENKEADVSRKTRVHNVACYPHRDCDVGCRGYAVQRCTGYFDVEETPELI